MGISILGLRPDAQVNKNHYSWWPKGSFQSQAVMIMSNSPSPRASRVPVGLGHVGTASDAHGAAGSVASGYGLTGFLRSFSGSQRQPAKIDRPMLPSQHY